MRILFYLLLSYTVLRIERLYTLLQDDRRCVIQDLLWSCLLYTSYVDFEGYQFPVPKEYDKYLTYLYGDYMQMIPVSQRRTSHSIVLMDLGAYGDYRLEQTKGRSDEK